MWNFKKIIYKTAIYYTKQQKQQEIIKLLLRYWDDKVRKEKQI